jgi:4-aminobutyrate aminotransferase-like enzyme
VPLLSITEAARLFGKSRTTLYKYNKSGMLSFVSDTDGRPAVDLSEMLRVFGAVQNTTVHDEHREHQETVNLNAEHLALEAKVAALQEIVRRQDALLAKAEEREQWLQERLERSQQQMQALIHQPGDNTKPSRRKWWWPW